MGLADKRVAKRPLPKPEAELSIGFGGHEPNGRTAGPDRLTAALIPEKLGSKYARAFLPVVGELAAIGGLRDQVDAWRLKGFDRIIAQFYKGVGAALDATPVPQQAELVQAAARSLSGLIAKVGTGDLLVPCISTLDALVNTAVRFAAKRRIALAPGELARLYTQAGTATAQLLDTLDGRSGRGAALNLLPTLVEEMAGAESKKAPLTAASLIGLWGSVRGLIEAGPSTGLSQADAGKLATALAEALKAGADPAATIEDAKRRFRAGFDPVRAEVAAQLAEAPPAHYVGTPSEASYQAMHAAFAHVMEANPAPTAGLVAQLYATRAALLPVIDPNSGIQPEVRQVLIDLIARYGATPLAERMLAYVQGLAPQLAYYQAQALGPLLAASQAQAPGEVAAHLLDAALRTRGQAPEPLAAALQSLREAQGYAPLLAVLAVRPEQLLDAQSTAIMYSELGPLLATAGTDDLGGFFARYLPKKALFAQQLNAYGVEGADPQKRAELVEALARNSSFDVDANVATQAALALHYLRNYFPALPLLPLIADRPDGRGVVGMADPAAKNKEQPSQLLYQFEAQAQGLVMNQPQEVQVLAMMTAVDLAQLVARMDGQYQIPMQRIQADFVAALQNDEKLALLAGGNAVDVRVMGNGLRKFFQAHPELPRELALTAGVHLNAEQIGWLKTRIAGMKGRDTVRQLRDMVFACVTLNRLDLFEAIRTSVMPSKQLSKAIASIAHEYRNNRLQQLPVDRLIQGFRDGVDQTEGANQEALKAAIAAMPVHEPFDAAGVGVLSKNAEPIRNLLQQCVAGNMVDGYDTGRNKVPFERALQSVASGTWPEPKYESEIGKRLLGILSKEQQAIWRSETVIREGAAPLVGGADPRYAEVPVLSAGLALALQKIKLSHPKLPGLALDQASAQRLSALIEAHKALMQKHDKGSAEHRAGVNDLRQAIQLLAIVELSLGLRAAPADPAALLGKLKPLLMAAEPALLALGFRSAAEIVGDLAAIAPVVKSAAREGCYAVDEDGLEALMVSTVGGCIHHANVRRWANINLVVNANEKIGRVYDEAGNFTYRACLKILEATLPNGYKGPVLWVNGMNQVGGQATARNLMYEMLVTKARLMGIPIATPWIMADLPANLGGPIAAQQQVTYHVDPGETGTIFTDYVMTTDVQAALAGKEKMDVALASYVLMPA